MNKIITITANTAIDNIVEVESFEIGGVIRAKNNQMFPSGKGINAARVVSTLEANVTVLGFVGENNYDLFKNLDSTKMKVDLLTVPNDTRVNMTILDASNNTETHIQVEGYKLCDNDIKALENKIDSLVKPNDFVIISGSLPMGIPRKTYKVLIEKCNEIGAKVILDSSGEQLKIGLLGKPYMIKPNIKELEELIGYSLTTEIEIIDSIKQSCFRDIKLVVVSRGAEGILVFDHANDKIFKAYLELDNNYTRFLGVGSGDSLVGGISVGLFKKMPLIEIIRLGVACGVANLLTMGPGICKYEDIEGLRTKVNIEELIEGVWVRVN